MFANQKEYNIMKDIIVKNKDLILNVKDVDKGASLVQQENRSLRIINIMNTIKISFYFIIAMLGVIIVFFTQYLLIHFFNNFYEEIEIKKLL
jgi:cytoskeletal protein RodZ